jgi:chloride channel protein, CIC family
MQKQQSSFEQFSIVSHLLKWTVLVIPVSIAVGSIVAFFLWMLEKVTTLRWHNEWLLFLLPLAGIFIHFLYKIWGKDSERGNNLIIDEIHKPGGGVPFGMTPLVLCTTIITHLFGGSAGREGTAVQMGGSIAALFGKWLNLNKEDIRILLMTGVAAGFGAVFGTPLAGAIFALEVLVVGKLNYKALLPCFIASVLADIVCRAWGIEHTHYTILSFTTDTPLFSFLHFDVFLLVKVILAGAAFGLAGYFFAELSHLIKYLSNELIPIKWLIPVIGGCIIIALTYILGTKDYLGLGVTNPNGGVSIVSCFKYGGAYYFSWFWKLLFTAITLSMGFKGGEVTPLFFIGAALGNTIALLTGAPVDFMAGLGFIAVFAGATNTPIACTIMGVELFGGEHILYYAVACFTAYYFSGHSGIYSAQRLGISKYHSKSD